MDIAVQTKHKEKLKEIRKRYKYLNIARELKKKQTIEHEVTVTPMVIRELGTFLKGLVLQLEDLEIKGHSETIETTALLRSARLLRRIWKT